MEQGLPDREKVIRGLENRIGESRNHGEIAVMVAMSTLEGALRLIREDGAVPALYTRADMINMACQGMFPGLAYGALWIETRLGMLCPAFIDIADATIRIRFYSPYFPTLDGRTDAWFYVAYYGKEWRAWTRKPSMEQRKEAAWK